MTRRAVLCVALLTAALTPTLRANDRIAAPSVPSDIAAPAGSRPFLRVHAVGTQNYICAPATTSTGVDWFFLGPQATLFDDVYDQKGTHFLSKNVFVQDALQATWQHGGDSSTVWATKMAGSTDPAHVAADAIEWLLLGVTGAQAGPAGGDRLARARFIHRVNTVGGRKPPSAECTPATINTRRFVNYEADYYFYR